MHVICPPKFCITIVFNLSWDSCNTQEKWKTKVMQNFGGQIDRFRSRGQQLCKLLGIKESFYIHKYGRRDVMWKRSIGCIMGDLQVAYTRFWPVSQSLLIIFSFVSIILNLVFLRCFWESWWRSAVFANLETKGKTSPSYLSQRPFRLLLRTGEEPWPSCSKLGWDNPGLVRNLNSDMKA